MISVLQVRPGRTIFTWLADPRLSLTRPGEPPPARPDIVLFPAGQSLDFAFETPDLPEEALSSIRSGHALVVLDSAQEAWRHHPERTQLVHDFFGRLGVSPARCVYLTQDRGYAA